MLLELALDLVKLTLFVACAYAALRAYARVRAPPWTPALTRRRLAVLGLLTLAVGASKVTEDVLAKESGPVDEAVLWFIREQVPVQWSGLFEAITRSGSAVFLLPLGLVALAALLLTRHRLEAALLAGSVASSTLLVYLLKVVVQRPRPDLWDTQWYWGSSFPSGHTLNTAALSIALALCLSRLWTRAGNLAMGCAILWTGLVALSRLVLGVHWPSDVLAAMCLGAFIPLLISVALDARMSKDAS